MTTPEYAEREPAPIPATAGALPKPSKKTELKVKAASWAAFLASLAGLTILETTATDLIPALPSQLNWLAPVLVSALASAITWAAGYNARTRPDGLSQSTVDAVQAWMQKRAPRIPR